MAKLTKSATVSLAAGRAPSAEGVARLVALAAEGRFSVPGSYPSTDAERAARADFRFDLAAAARADYDALAASGVVVFDETVYRSEFVEKAEIAISRAEATRRKRVEGFRARCDGAISPARALETIRAVVEATAPRGLVVSDRYDGLALDIARGGGEIRVEGRVSFESVDFRGETDPTDNARSLVGLVARIEVSGSSYRDDPGVAAARAAALADLAALLAEVGAAAGRLSVARSFGFDFEREAADRENARVDEARRYAREREAARA